MVATLYSYTPKVDGRTKVDNVHQVIANQDSGVAAGTRLTVVSALVVAAGFDIPDGYLVEEGVFGLPTGGPLDADDDIRVYAGEVTEVIS